MVRDGPTATMTTKTISQIHVGMEVYSHDGELMGCVSALWPHMPLTRDGGPPEPFQLDTDGSTTGYFQVDRRKLLGVLADHWYVPVTEVAEVRENRVILHCTAADCGERLTEAPWFATIDAG